MKYSILLDDEPVEVDLGPFNGNQTVPKVKMFGKSFKIDLPLDLAEELKTHKSIVKSEKLSSDFKDKLSEMVNKTLDMAIEKGDKKALLAMSEARLIPNSMKDDVLERLQKPNIFQKIGNIVNKTKDFLTSSFSNKSNLSDDVLKYLQDSKVSKESLEEVKEEQDDVKKDEELEKEEVETQNDDLQDKAKEYIKSKVFEYAKEQNEDLFASGDISEEIKAERQKQMWNISYKLNNDLDVSIQDFKNIGLSENFIKENFKIDWKQTESGKKYPAIDLEKLDYSKLDDVLSKDVFKDSFMSNLENIDFSDADSLIKDPSKLTELQEQVKKMKEVAEGAESFLKSINIAQYDNQDTSISSTLKQTSKSLGNATKAAVTTGTTGPKVS